MGCAISGRAGASQTARYIDGSEPSEDVRAQRCQRACEKYARAVSHPPSQSAVQPSSEELCVSVSVSSVRWRGQAAELPGAAAHSGGRKRGREQAGNRLPGGRNEGSGAIALRIDGGVGVATGFSMSVSRPSYGRAKTLDRNAPLVAGYAREPNLTVPAEGVVSKASPGFVRDLPLSFVGYRSQNTKANPGHAVDCMQCAVTTLLQPARILTTSAIQNKR